MSVLNIKDSETHRLASELARRTGLSLTAAVREALRERLAREESPTSEQARKLARVMEIARRCAARPVLDPRTPEEILGYDENGIPR